MPQEVTKRHAIIEALRADRTAKEIIDFFSHNKDLVYRIEKQFETSDDLETFTGERKTHKRRSDAIRSPELVTKVAPLDVMEMLCPLTSFPMASGLPQTTTSRSWKPWSSPGWLA